MAPKQSLWDEYCSFFERDFEDQLDYNRKRKEEFFEKWKKTKAADHLLPEGAEDFEDVTVTTYEDYPALHRFGKKMETKVKKNPKPEGMSWKNYYKRMEKGLIKDIEKWVPEDYGGCAKTTGTTGSPKWFVMGKKYLQEYKERAISQVVLSGSEEWGQTKVERGDTVLNIGVPIPYISGHFYYALLNEFNLFPSIQFTDSELNMKAKLSHIIRNIQDGKDIHVVGGLASTFQLFVQAIVAPEKTYADYYRNQPFGVKKALAYLMYLKENLKNNEIERANEVLPIKGSATSGLDVKLYKDYLTHHFGLPPLNVYGSTELGVLMMGRPGRRTDLIPNLKLRYIEFLDDEGKLHQIDELKEGETYQLIGTPFGTPLIRYNQKDLLTVKDHLDDGMPVFEFEGRKESWLSIRGYFRLSERMAFEVMKKIGFEKENRWAVTKRIEPNEHLCFILEENTKENIIEKIYQAMYEMFEDFRSYVSDFNIDDPSEIIDAEILSRGSFKRYSLQQMEKDIPIGQYKAPKIISPEDKEIIESLRSA